MTRPGPAPLGYALFLALAFAAAAPACNLPTIDVGTGSTGDASSSQGDASTSEEAASSSSTTAAESETTGDDDADGTSSTGYLQICGDGLVQTDAGEICDLGAGNSDNGVCKLDCTPAACGDGYLQSGEACDDGADNGPDKACTPVCSVAACGDGFVFKGIEGCDAGDLNSDTVPNACRTDCTPATCGDGVVDYAEVCDDSSCAADCSRYEQEGVAFDVAEADLNKGWHQCWSGSYLGGGTTNELYATCKGMLILLGCRAVGSGSLSVAAMAPKLDILGLIQSGSIEALNGTLWRWSKAAKRVEFGPNLDGNCNGGGGVGGLCWPTDGDKFVGGGYCHKIALGPVNGGSWERVAFMTSK